MTFFRVIFIKFGACTECGSLKPITQMSPFSKWVLFFMSSYCYAGFDMRTMARAPFSKAEQDARFQLQMDFFFVNFLIKWNFRQAEHLSFITRCVSFVTGFSEVMKRL